MRNGGGGGDFCDGISGANESVPLLGHSHVVDKLQVSDTRRPNSGVALFSVHKSFRLGRREDGERGDRRGWVGRDPREASGNLPRSISARPGPLLQNKPFLFYRLAAQP